MRLDHVWSMYAVECLGDPSAPPVALSPMETLGLLFDWHPHFTPRMPAIEMVRHNAAFDEEADGALCALATNGDFETWEQISAGAWRVLSNRLIYAETVCLLNERNGTVVMTRLPKGLTPQQQSITAGLQFLLGGARSIEPRLLAKWRREPPGLLPASTLLRRQ